MCNRPYSDLTTALVRFLTERHDDMDAELDDLARRFPRVTERDLDRAEAIAFEVVRARIAGDHGRQERQEGEP